MATTPDEITVQDDGSSDGTPPPTPQIKGGTTAPTTSGYPQMPPPIAGDWEQGTDSGNSYYHSTSLGMVYWPDSGTFAQYTPDGGIGEHWSLSDTGDMPSWLSQTFDKGQNYYQQSLGPQNGPPPVANDWQQNQDAKGNTHYFSPSTNLVYFSGQGGQAGSLAQWDPSTQKVTNQWDMSQGGEPPQWITSAVNNQSGTTAPSDDAVNKIKGYGWQQDGNGNWFDPKTGDHGMFSQDGTQFINQTQNVALDPHTGQTSVASFEQPFTTQFDPNATYQNGGAFIPNLPTVPGQPGIPTTTAFTPGGGATPTAPAPFQAPSTDDMEKLDPGYAFRLQQGQQAVERSAAAKGMLNTGNTMLDVMKYGQDYASGEYQNVYGRALTTNTQNFGQAQAENNTSYQRAIADQQLGYNQAMANYQAQTGQAWDVNNAAYQRALEQYQQSYNIFNQNQGTQYNRLAGLAGVGQTATGDLNSAGTSFANAMTGAGANYASNVGNILTGTATGIGQLMQSGANAQAAGTVGAANAWSGALGGIGNTATSLAMLNAFKPPTTKAPGT